MPLVNVPPTFTPTQIEFTARKKGAAKEVKEIKRSVEGALHLRPGVVFLTKDEMEFLKQHRPDVHGRLQFVALTQAEREEIQASESAPTPAPAPVAPVIDPPVEEPAPIGGAGRGRSRGS